MMFINDYYVLNNPRDSQCHQPSDKNKRKVKTKDMWTTNQSTRYKHNNFDYKQHYFRFQYWQILQHCINCHLENTSTNINSHLYMYMIQLTLMTSITKVAQNNTGVHTKKQSQQKFKIRNKNLHVGFESLTKITTMK